jgi:ubiquinone/menaquinone biosynthesis C-methylase UbiE
VVASFVFCSVPDPVLGLKEAYRITKPGGKLLILEHMLSENPVVAWMMQRIDALVHWVLGYHIARQTVKNVEAAGWKIGQVDTLDIFKIHRIISAHRGG